MKKMLFFCLFAVAAVYSKAQTPKLVVTDSTVIKPQQLLFPNRIIAKNSKGTVYALPQDKMPCLVPDSSMYSGSMPNAYTGNYNPKTIPNPYNKRPLSDTLLQLLKPSAPVKTNK